jgi:hypothetical protein
MGNSWLRGRSGRQRLCARLREASPVSHPLGGVAQRQERSLVRRDAAGSSPVVPALHDADAGFAGVGSPSACGLLDPVEVVMASA